MSKENHVGIEQFSNSSREKAVINPQLYVSSRVAQWKRAGPITQRSEDQNLALLIFLFIFFSLLRAMFAFNFLISARTL